MSVNMLGSVLGGKQVRPGSSQACGEEPGQEAGILLVLLRHQVTEEYGLLICSTELSRLALCPAEYMGDDASLCIFIVLQVSCPLLMGHMIDDKDH